MAKPATILLATAPSLDEMYKVLRDFYVGCSKTLIPTSDTSWKIIGTYDGKEMAGIRVVLKRKRYRLELVKAD